MYIYIYMCVYVIYIYLIIYIYIFTLNSFTIETWLVSLDVSHKHIGRSEVCVLGIAGFALWIYHANSQRFGNTSVMIV